MAQPFFILKSEKWTLHLFSAAFSNVFIFEEDEKDREKILKYFIPTITMHCVVALLKKIVIFFWATTKNILILILWNNI